MRSRTGSLGAVMKHAGVPWADAEAMRRRLQEKILDKAFQVADIPVFKLVSGAMSRFYFNCKRVTLDPEGMVLIGHLIFERIKDLNIHGIGGLTLGADPIANAVAYTSWIHGHPIQAFVVRKAQKEHGIPARIEGNLREGDRVVVVDDVITTGGSTIQAIRACKAAGLHVVRAVVLVDRQEMNGRENILQEVDTVDALVLRDDIMALHEARAAGRPARGLPS